MKILYFKKLDSLRFIAFFLVFWQHAYSDFFHNLFGDSHLVNKFTNTGGVGVHIFFVLSGFLITYLMIKENELTGFFNLKKFYARRILRIWPLYYLIVILGIFVLPNLSNTFHFCGNVLYNFFFFNNFDFGNSCTAKNVNITWSVAIEEQFYLFWPMIFILFKKHLKILFYLCLLIFVLSILFKVNVNELEAYFHTFSNLGYLMVGCMGAIYFSKRLSTNIINLIKLKKTFYLLLLILIILVYIDSIVSTVITPFIYFYIILYLIFTEKKEEKTSVFSRLGKYTFGMYIYHPTIIIMSKIIFDLIQIKYQNAGLGNLLLGFFTLILTILFSIFSYHFFEAKILRFKSKYEVVKTRI